MFNKLLKRCMPWMDKGRWYHVRVNTIGEKPYAVFDPVFESVSFNDFNFELKIPSGRQYQMINAKATINKFKITNPEITKFIDATNLYIATSQTAHSTIEVALFSDAIVDYWFFMAPLDEYIKG